MKQLGDRQLGAGEVAVLHEAVPGLGISSENQPRPLRCHPQWAASSHRPSRPPGEGEGPEGLISFICLLMSSYCGKYT